MSITNDNRNELIGLIVVSAIAFFAGMTVQSLLHGTPDAPGQAAEQPAAELGKVEKLSGYVTKLYPSRPFNGEVGFNVTEGAHAAEFIYLKGLNGHLVAGQTSVSACPCGTYRWKIEDGRTVTIPMFVLVEGK